MFIVKTFLKTLKEPVELGNPNTSAEVKTEVPKTVRSG